MDDHLARNFEKVLADGPGLRYDYETRAVARGDGVVLKSGLGAMGLGQMWVRADTDDPRYAALPYVDRSEPGL